MPLRKKMSLIALFLVSAVLIGITAYRIPSTINRRAAQPFRSLIASLEILAAAFVANVVIIGSFIRDKGVKKAKFRQDSESGASEVRRTMTRTRTQSITLKHWGSDEDLVSGMGMALPTTLRSGLANEAPRTAPVAPPGEVDVLDEIKEEKDLEKAHEKPQEKRRKSSQKLDMKWALGGKGRKRRGSDSSVSTVSSDDDLKGRRDEAKFNEPEPLSKQMGFFDVGGLVDAPNGGTPTPSGNSREPSVRDFPTTQRGRSGSKAFMTDIGGLISRRKEEHGETSSSNQPSSRRESQTHLGVGTATSRSLTPVQNTKGMERRKFSRSPRPMLEHLRSDRSESRRREASYRRRRDITMAKMAPTASPRLGPRETGADEMSFGDAGGLLR